MKPPAVSPNDIRKEAAFLTYSDVFGKILGKFLSGTSRCVADQTDWRVYRRTLRLVEHPLHLSASRLRSAVRDQSAGREP